MHSTRLLPLAARSRFHLKGRRVRVSLQCMFGRRSVGRARCYASLAVFWACSSGAPRAHDECSGTPALIQASKPPFQGVLTPPSSLASAVTQAETCRALGASRQYTTDWGSRTQRSSSRPRGRLIYPESQTRCISGRFREFLDVLSVFQDLLGTCSESLVIPCELTKTLSSIHLKFHTILRYKEVRSEERHRIES